jgi:hypothetical protein
MESDKDIALGLVELLQDFYLRLVACHSVLKVRGITDAHYLHEWLSENPEVQESVRAEFEPLRQHVFDAPDLSTVVQYILSEVPRIDPSGSGPQN